MFNKKNSLLTVVILMLVFVFAFTLTGCPMRKENSGTPRPPAQNKTIAAEKVSAVAARVDGVEDAYAVMLGTNIVLVGIQLEDRNVPRNEMVKMEDKVAKRIIEKVNVIETAYVTAAPNVVKRIRNISEKVSKGQPVEKFQKDTNNIIKDLREVTR